MKKRNRVHVNFRVVPETAKFIRKYAKKHGISEGLALDHIVASVVFAMVTTNANGHEES
jgi:hypothetical protein